MIEILLTPFFIFGAATFYFGLVSLAYYPLALAYPFWERRLLARARRAAYRPSVSVLIPAYNEERAIAASVESVLASDYPDFEVIVINDGSTDDTETVLRPFIESNRVRYVRQPNRGKAAALNHGLSLARGEIVLFTDADSLFERETLLHGVAYFVDPAIGAVGGNDTPLHPHGALQKMLVITSHIGTGFVRRALSLARVLPILPGNLGLVRRALLVRIGGFRNVWGEDLEITWRLHRERVRVVYGAQTRVLAECPSTIAGLWKQRVRWMRSYLKVLAMHRDMVGNPRFGAFGPYLVLNSINMVLVPVLQALALLGLPLAVFFDYFSLYGWEWIAYTGLGFLLLAAVVSILLDRSPRDLLYLPYGLLLIVFSHFYNAVVLYSLWAQWHAHVEDWHKLERRGPRRAARSWPATTVVVAAVVAVAAFFAIGFWFGTRQTLTPPAMTLPLYPQQGTTAVAIHFDAWRDWRDAYQQILAQPQARFINHVGVSAGRADWTYFRWQGGEDWWSPEQKRAEGDMLETAIAALSARGYETTAILDVFASRYIERFPDAAATDVDGRRGKDVICSTVLAEGDYGRHLEHAVSALAASTSAGTIAITELFYDRYCYDDRCLLAFRRATGRADWPRTRAGKIDILDPAVGAWRSSQVAGVVQRLARAIKSQGKRFALDVKLSRGNVRQHSVENGQDYRLLAPWVDQFIVWDYFALDGRTPESSAGVAAYLEDDFGPDKFFLSVGLWRPWRGYIGEDLLARALTAARLGGADHIWITPGKPLDDDHWRVIAEHVQAKGPPAPAP